jgi:catechol 2,3-dioxygenase-like lactoylglutathione lyase family enzyme
MSNDAAASLAAADQAATIAGISHLAINVADPDRARDFYGELGFVDAVGQALPNCGEHRLVATVSRQYVALCRGAAPGASLAKTGIHNAYRMSPEARADIVERLRRRGIEIFTYKEDRPEEAVQNCYLHDPDGNRIQLVADPALAGPGIAAIDHAAIQAIDVEWEEKFYVGTLGMTLAHVVGWRTEDYVRAEAWAEGKEDMAPGSRRLDKRYFAFPGQPTHRPRPNMQLYVTSGSATLGIYLVTEHMQEPPEEQAVGTPRIGLKLTRDALAELASRLRPLRRALDGPVRHGAGAPFAASLYVRDPGANFLEFCCD